MYAIGSGLRAAIAELCREYGVRELLLFGSAARDDFRPESSDIDLLYVFEPQAEVGWFELCDLSDKLQQLFGRPVQLVPKQGLNPIIRDRVLAEAQPIYPDGKR